MSKQDDEYNIHMASEFYVMACLYRLGFDAYLTLGSKKSVDIVVTRGIEDTVSVDVKGIKDSSGDKNWRVGKYRGADARHFYIFVDFKGSVHDIGTEPDVYIVPSTSVGELRYVHNELSWMRGSKLRKCTEFKNAWSLLHNVMELCPA